MLRNWLRAAWGDLARSPMQSAIAIGGLALGLMAAIIAGVVTLDAFTKDHFVKGYQSLYVAAIDTHDRHDSHSRYSPHDLAGYLRAFPGIERVARTSSNASFLIRYGEIVARESQGVWADPDFFRMYQVPVLYGDLSTALDRPDGLVVSAAIAEKYFGRDNVLGQTLLVNHRPMVVRAVIADWLPNSATYAATIYASSLSPYSRMSKDIGTQGMSKNGGMKIDMTTWVTLAPGASVSELDRLGTALVSRFVPPGTNFSRGLHFERSDDINLSPRLNPDNRARLYVMEAAAVMILLLACINFVNLTIARSVQRSREVAIRKVLGAARRYLLLQFLGEAVLQALFALCVATALVEWTLPAVNAFMKSAARFDYWRDPALLAAALGGAILVGMLAGIWPAMILSAFRPALVLKGLARSIGKGAWLRQSLVGFQFAALVVFLISAATVFQQSRFATSEAMRVKTDQILFITMPKCSEAFRDRIAHLPGVLGTACSQQEVLPPISQSNEAAKPRDGGPPITIQAVGVGYGFLELFGIKPVAGRLFREGEGDAIPDDADPGRRVHYIINEEAVHELHYADAQSAIGQALFRESESRPMAKPGDPPDIYPRSGTIVGVVKDFSFTPEFFLKTANNRKFPPIAYSLGTAEVNLPDRSELLHVKLDGRDIPEALARIDAAWLGSGATDPIQRQFLNAYVESREETVRREGEAFAAFAVIAMLLACLGLFGISYSSAARKTKEIGIRKSMGASNGDILRLLLWQFAKPAMLANLLAWPVAFWAMQAWLASFPLHVDLALWLFPAAALVSLAVAIAAVTERALSAARRKPALALRYE